MKIVLLFALLVYSFLEAKSNMTLEESKHLLNRTSFSYTKKDLDFFTKLSKEQAVTFIIKQAKRTTTIKKIKDIKEVSLQKSDYKKLTREEKTEIRKKRNRKMHEVQAWWYKMMLKQEYSFREKMTLFWHNHFTSSYKVVKNPYMMYKQNILYRNNSVGSFSSLLTKSSKDLAMLIYLDNNSNKKSHANENYARELLELFTLGEGNYSEEDVKEAARAFTGYKVSRKKLSYKLVKKQHDYGQKTFLKQSGNFNADDIINIILQQDRTAVFITSKLVKEFIGTNISKKRLAMFSKKFRDSSYDIAVVLKEILLSDEFWSDKANMIKSPVELIVSLIKNLNLDIKQKDFRFISKQAKNLGQDLFNPPSVKGWGDNETWIDTSSLVLRYDFITKVLNKRLNKKKIKNLNISNYEKFENYFFTSVSSKLNNKKFISSKKEYIKLLTNPRYQLK